MPPMPNLYWFLEQGGSLRRFSQSSFLQVPAGLKHDALLRACRRFSIITMRCACVSPVQTAAVRNGSWKFNRRER